MRRLFIFLFVFNALLSCSKKTNPPYVPVVIPNKITGTITEINVTPINITTPDKGFFLISVNNTFYKVDFNVVEQSQSNAALRFASDSILIDESREYANLGKDAIAYNPLKANEIIIDFTDGRKVTGFFDINSSFGGVFGEALISQWRDPADPTKPIQKANDDISAFIRRYADKDGPGPETAPLYLSVEVSIH